MQDRLRVHQELDKLAAERLLFSASQMSFLRSDQSAGLHILANEISRLRNIRHEGGISDACQEP
jgi:hypothetical protein